MHAHKIETILSENGTLVLKGLPFQAGEAVEVIILKQPVSHQQLSPEVSNPYPLQGQQPYHYDDPFEPATPLEDWEALQ